MHVRSVSILSSAAFVVLAGCSRTTSQTTASPPPQEWQTSAAQPAPEQPAGVPPAMTQAAEAPPAVSQPSPYGSDAPITGVGAALPPPANPPGAALPPPALPAYSAEPPPQNLQGAGRTQPVLPPPAEVAIPAGVPLAVRVDENINTRRNRAGEGFDATLTNAVIVGGLTVLPAGTRFHGHITRSKPSGRLKGRAVLVLTLDGFRFDGRRYRIRTDQVERESGSHRKRDAVAIGGGAGFGATMGAIAGGPVGAAVGAAAGAGGGVVGAAVTGKKEVGIRAESLMRFRLESPVAL